MLQHLGVLLSIINLLVGTAVVIYLFNNWKYTKFKCLKTLALHSIFFNILIFLQLLTRYITANDVPISKINLSLIEIGHPLLMVFLFLATGMFYVLILTIYRLRNRKNKVISILFFTIVGLIAVGLIMINTSVLSKRMEEYYKFFLDNSLVLFIIIEIILLFLLMNENKEKKNNGQKINLAFSILYLSRYPLIVMLLFLSSNIRWLSSFFILLYFNLLPAIWTKYYLLKYKPGLINFIERKKPLTQIFHKYELTSREQEIIRLIIDGKSNKEIGDQLFISLNTVKNHLYSIYKKIRVKNRYELIHIFTKILDHTDISER
jgi:DNA-binding CsgD family transcriptional regulator